MRASAIFSPPFDGRPSRSIWTSSYNGFDHAFFTQSRYCIGPAALFQSRSFAPCVVPSQHLFAQLGTLCIMHGSEVVTKRAGLRFVMCETHLQAPPSGAVESQQT